MKCRNNHESTSTDFCSVCGIEMGGEAESAATVAPAPHDHHQETCPVCGSVKTDNFCGECGYNFITKTGGIVEPPPVQPTVLTAPAAAAAPASISPAPIEAPPPPADIAPAPAAAEAEKLEVYLTVDTTVEGAPQTPLRIFPLESGDYPIGRSSLSRKIKPAIPADGDDGVSHKHALIREEGAGFAIMDLGSSNGTMLNGVEIIPNTVHILKKDDVISIGRWTRLTIHSRAT
jgi:hypothetical protein